MKKRTYSCPVCSVTALNICHPVLAGIGSNIDENNGTEIFDMDIFDEL